MHPKAGIVVFYIRDLPARSHIDSGILRNPPSDRHGHSNCVDRNFPGIKGRRHICWIKSTLKRCLRQAPRSNAEIYSKVTVTTGGCCIHQTMCCAQVCQQMSSSLTWLSR